MIQASIHRRLRNSCVLLCALATTGAAWWDGLGVDPEEYSEDWVQDGRLYEYKIEDSFPRQAARLQEDLQHVPVEELLSRCEAVVAAGVAAEAEREQLGDDPMRHVPQSWYGGPRVRAWLLCAVAMRRMSESEDLRWGPVLERLYDNSRQRALLSSSAVKARSTLSP